MASQRTTLAEVAAAAGVSIATVSKVVNDRPDVSASTRDRVRDLLDRHGYQRSTPRTIQRPAPVIEIGTPDLDGAYGWAVIDAITTAARTRGFRVQLGGRRLIDLHPDPSNGNGGADPDAIIMITLSAVSDQLRSLGELGLPVVVVDPYEPPPPGMVSIGATNFSGGVAATQHLLDLGHTRIAHACGPDTAVCTQARLAGYTSALRQAGVALDESLITECEFRYEAADGPAELLLDRADRPTAIFAGNDEIALGLIEQARRRGLRVPEDLSVVGFDDTLLAVRSTPQLTTVAQPLAEMGHTAVQAIAQLIGGERVSHGHIELATRLMVRDSTAPPRQPA